PLPEFEIVVAAGEGERDQFAGFFEHRFLFVPPLSPALYTGDFPVFCFPRSLVTGPSESFGSSESNTSRSVTERFTATSARRPSEFSSVTTVCRTSKSAPDVAWRKGHSSLKLSGRPVRVT